MEKRVSKLTREQRVTAEAVEKYARERGTKPEYFIIKMLYTKEVGIL